MTGTSGSSTTGEASHSTRVEVYRQRFHEAVQVDTGCRIEAVLTEVPYEIRSDVLASLLNDEIAARRARGETPALDDYRRRFPDDLEAIDRCFDNALFALTANGASPVTDPNSPTIQYTPSRQIHRYELLDKLGTGGFGEVWRARDALLQRTVAIKMHRRESASAGSELDELLKEGQKLSQLNHEGIVRVLDAGLEDGRFYLVSEYMAGGSLEARLKSGPVAREDAIRWIIVLARALHAAHTRGYIHRDVKPGNILFDEECRPHLADFGVAVSEDEQAQEEPNVVGTWVYMSPEQALGNSHLADARSDVYSLGVVFYRLLVGRLPFAAADWRAYREQMLSRPAKPLRVIDESIVPEIEAVCLKCLERDVGRRYTTALEVAEELEAWQQTVAQPPAPSPPPRTRSWAPYGISVALLLVAFGGWSLRARPENGKPLQDPVADKLLEGAKLSWKNPEAIAWTPFNTEDRHGYHASRNEYRIEAFGNALFKAGDLPAPFRIRTSFSIHEGKGYAGLFWSLKSVKNADFRCWAIMVGRDDPSFPTQVSIRDNTLGPTPGGRRGVTFDGSCWVKTVKDFGGNQAVLEADVDSGSVAQIWLNGEPLLESPLELNPSDWIKSPGMGYGFAAHLGTVSIHEFSVK